MSSKFIADIIKEINAFRAKPAETKKKCSVFLTGMSRMKVNEKFTNEIKEFIEQVDQIKPINPLTLNALLSKSAEAQLEKYIKNTEGYNSFLTGKTIKGIVPEAFEQEKPSLIADNGADDASDVPVKLLFNLKDVNHIGRDAILNQNYTQVGIAHKTVDDENYMIYIFANNDAGEEEEDEKDYKLPKGDLTELKQAFDLFDYEKNGKIRIASAIDAMKRMKFDTSDPTLFEILNELSKNEFVNWPKFASHVVMRMSDRNTEDGLQTIFDLFIDNPEQNTITFETFKRIVKEIGETMTDDEMKHILQNTTEKGNAINFTDFCEYMQISN